MRRAAVTESVRCWRTRLVRKLPPKPLRDVVVDLVGRAAHCYPGVFPTDEERPATGVKVGRLTRPLGSSPVVPAHDPTPLVFLHARDDPLVISGRWHRGEVLLRQLARFSFV